MGEYSKSQVIATSLIPRHVHMPSSYLSLLRAMTLCCYEVFMCLFQNGLGTKPTHISWLVRATPFVKGGKALWKENSGTTSPLPPSLVPQPGPLVVGASPSFDHCKWWRMLTQIWGLPWGQGQHVKGSPSFLWGLKGQHQSLAGATFVQYLNTPTAGRLLLINSLQKVGLSFSFPQNV